MLSTITAGTQKGVFECAVEGGNEWVPMFLELICIKPQYCMAQGREGKAAAGCAGEAGR